MDESRGIKSIEAGGILLEALSTVQEPLELRQIAGLAGMSMSRAHAYMTSFVRMGLAKQAPATKRYALGSFAIEIGLSELRGMDPIELALGALGRLSRRVDQTVSLSVWGSHGPTVIRVHGGSTPLHSTLYEGARLPMRSTATGRAFCAFLSTSVVAKALALEDEGQEHIDDEFDGAVRDAQKHGYARIVDRPVPGLASYSAPVLNHSSRMIFALTVTGRVGTFGARSGENIVDILLETAQLLSERLGKPVDTAGRGQTKRASTQ